LLAAAGGSTVAETVRRIMRKLMTTAVAIQLNWKGTRGKVGLSTLEVKNVIFGQYLLNMYILDSISIEYTS